MAGSPPCFQLRCSNPTFGWAALGARGPLGVQGEAGDALAEASSPPLPSLPSLCLHPPMTVPLPSYSFLLPPGGSRTIPRGISLPVVFFSFSPFCLLPTSDLRHACWKIRLHSLSPGVLDTGRPSSSTLLTGTFESVESFLNSYNLFCFPSIAHLLCACSLCPGLPPL